MAKNKPHSKLLEGFPFTLSPRGAIAQLHGFSTASRWSVFADGGRYALTGHLMNRGGFSEGGYADKSKR